MAAAGAASWPLACRYLPMVRAPRPCKKISDIACVGQIANLALMVPEWQGFRAWGDSNCLMCKVQEVCVLPQGPNEWPFRLCSDVTGYDFGRLLIPLPGALLVKKSSFKRNATL